MESYLGEHMFDTVNDAAPGARQHWKMRQDEVAALADEAVKGDGGAFGKSPPSTKHERIQSAHASVRAGEPRLRHPAWNARPVAQRAGSLEAIRVVLIPNGVVALAVANRLDPKQPRGRAR